jgi:hypothetical protein
MGLTCDWIDGGDELQHARQACSRPPRDWNEIQKSKAPFTLNPPLLRLAT